MEIWDLYDRDRLPTGRTGVRGQPLPQDTYHLVVHICIFNSRGEMLIQQRQPFKKGWSNLWDVSVGGSACQGENSQTAAHRETLEELGLDLNFRQERPFLTVAFDRGFDDFYLLQRDVDLQELTLQPEEVQAVRWENLSEIEKMIDRGEFVPYHQNLLPLLFSMVHYRGALRNIET